MHADVEAKELPTTIEAMFVLPIWNDALDVALPGMKAPFRAASCVGPMCHMWLYT